MSEFARWFLGIEVPTSVASPLGNTLSRWAAPSHARVGWVPASAYHVTLRYLGVAPVTARDAIATTMTRVARSAQPFDAVLTNVGAFPVPEAASVIWVGMEANAQLVALAAACDAAIVNLGFAAMAEPFVPHVTFARLAEPSNLGPWLASAPPVSGRWHVSSLALFQREDKGYRVIARAPLGALITPEPTLDWSLESIQTDDGWPRGAGPAE